MRSRGRAHFGTVALIVALLVGCSEAVDKTPEDQQQERPDHEHVYRCDDGRRLFVAFEDGGLRVRIRSANRAQPVILTAKSQGRPYLGAAGAAALHGSVLRVTLGNEATLACIRA